MHLDVQLQHGFAPPPRGADGSRTFTLDVQFDLTSRAVALVGPSGSGKTTILNAIAGMFRPAHGRIVLDGVTLIDTSRRIYLRQSRRRIGYVFQDGRLFPHLTVRQNLLYGRWFAPRAEHGLSLHDIVDLLGIGRLLDRRPEALSGGEKQRVAIGRALLAKPRILLMDEPLAALDMERRQQILPLVERLRDELALPIVLVSHDPSEVARVATSVVEIANGRIVPRTKPDAKILPEGAYGSAHIISLAPHLRKYAGVAGLTPL